MAEKDRTFSNASLAARLIFFAFGMGISSWAPLIPFAKSKLGLNEAELGMIMLVFGIGALGAMPLSGWLVQRFSSRLITFISGILVAACLPLLPIQDSTFALCIVLFFFGAATSALNISINAQAMSIESRYELPLMSGFHCLFSLGGLFGALIPTILLTFGADFFTITLVIASIMTTLIVLQWYKLIPNFETRKLEMPTQTRYSLPEKKVLLLGLLCFIAFMAEGSMLDWSAEYLLSSLDYHESWVGIGYALFSVTMVIGRLFGNQIIQRFGERFVFQMGSFITAAGFIMLVVVRVGYCELLGFSLIGLGASNLVPILFSSSGKLKETPANYALTIVTSCGYMGMLFGPACIGFLANATTLSVSFAMIGILLIAIGVIGRAVLKPTPSPLTS